MAKRSLLDKGQLLNVDHHVIRYVAPKHIHNGEINGSGFLARAVDSNHVSFNWMEYYDPPAQSQVDEIRSCRRVNYAKTGRLAQVNIRRASELVAEMLTDKGLSVKYDPLEATDKHPADPSHSLMFNVPTEDDPLGELIGDLISKAVAEEFDAHEDKK